MLPSLNSLPELNEVESSSNAYEKLKDDFEQPSEDYTNSFNIDGWIGQMNLDLILSCAIEEGASDVHITADMPICFTINKDIVKKTEFIVPNDDIMNDLGNSILTNVQAGFYVRDKDFDFSYKIRFGRYEGRRFRANIGRSFSNNFLVFRTINDIIPTPAEIGIPQEIVNWANFPQGVWIVGGATGSGKALHINTDIPTPNGYIKLKNLKKGMQVFDKNGNISTVIDKYSPKSKKFYQMKLSDGTVIDSADNHLWEITVFDKKTKEIIEHNTIMDSERIFKNRNRYIFGIKNNKATVGDFDISLENPYDDGFNLTENIDTITKYKFAEFEQRALFMAGVIDSHIVTFNNNKFFLQSKSKKATQTVKEICCSLGWHTTAVENNAYYEFSFFPTERIPVLYEALNDENKRFYTTENIKKTDKYTYIDIIENIPGLAKEYYCISIDSPTKVFLCTKHFLPTHNSTTLASIIHNLQLRERKKIITIEKPIEYVYPENVGKALIVQRDVGEDTLSFYNGLTFALRQNPDIILIGEVRNTQEVEELIRAAETGHLAISTIHTNSVATTFNRIFSLFPSDDQARLRSTLSDTLRGIVNQTLVRKKDGSGVFAVREVLSINNEVRDYISKGDIKKIKEYLIRENKSMEQQLVKSLLEDKCTYEEARQLAPDVEFFEHLLENSKKN